MKEVFKNVTSFVFNQMATTRESIAVVSYVGNGETRRVIVQYDGELCLNVTTKAETKIGHDCHGFHGMVP